MIVYIIVLASLSLVFWIGFPLLKAEGNTANLDELTQERTRSLLDSLGALYATKEAGKVEEDDFANIESRLMLELAKIYRDQGVDPKASIAKGVCPSCHARIKNEFRFCPGCGAQAA